MSNFVVSDCLELIEGIGFSPSISIGYLEIYSSASIRRMDKSTALQSFVSAPIEI